MTTCLVFLSFFPYIFCLKRSRKLSLDFRHLGLFELRCLDQQLLVTSYHQSLARLSLFCSLRHLVFVRLCTTVKTINALILYCNNCLVTFLLQPGTVLQTTRHSLTFFWYKMNATLKVSIQDQGFWHSCFGILCEVSLGPKQ